MTKAQPIARRVSALRRTLSLPLLASLALPWVAPQSAYAVGEQNGRLRGSVVEAGSQVPLPGAQVTIKKRRHDRPAHRHHRRGRQLRLPERAARHLHHHRHLRRHAPDQAQGPR